MEVSEARRLRSVEKENSELKKLVAELTLGDLCTMRVFFEIIKTGSKNLKFLPAWRSHHPKITPVRAYYDSNSSGFDSG